MTRQEILQEWLTKLGRTRYASQTGVGAKSNCDMLLSLSCDKHMLGRARGGKIVFAEIYDADGVAERIEGTDYQNLLKRLIMHVYSRNNDIIIALHMLVWARANKQ